jgi:hypothetical protein
MQVLVFTFFYFIMEFTEYLLEDNPEAYQLLKEVSPQSLKFSLQPSGFMIMLCFDFDVQLLFARVFS